MSDYFKKMSVFTIGHDKMFRPILYIYPGRVKAHEIDTFTSCICFYYMAIQLNLIKEYFIENWIIIVDLEGLGFLNFPFKALRTLIDSTGITFAGRLHKIILVNPTFMFYGVWKIIQSFLHPESTQRIDFISKGKHSDFLKYINKDQLIDKYGGLMKSPVSAFPIMTTFQPDDQPELEECEDTYFPNVEVEANEKTISVLMTIVEEKLFFEKDFCDV